MAKARTQPKGKDARSRTMTTTGRLSAQKAKRNATALLRAETGRMPMGLLTDGDTQQVHARELVKRYVRWVHRCTTLVAETAAAVPLRLFTIGNKQQVEKNWMLRPRRIDARTKALLTGRMDWKPGSAAQKRLAGNIDDMTEITNHEVLDLFDSINPYENGFAFRDLWYRDLQVCAQFFTHLVAESDDAPPHELWRCVPPKMKVAKSVTDFVDHYEYGDGPQPQRFSREEIFWVRLPHLSDPWGAFGPLEAWLKTIDADYAMVAFQDWLFRHGGQPDVIFSVKDGMGPESRRAFRSEYRSMFGDQTNRRENMAILEGEAELHELSHAPKEMEYSASRLQIRDEIGNAFGVPKSLLTSDDVNRANGDAGLIQLMRHTVQPMVRRVEDAINQGLLPRWSDRLLIIHDNPIPEDKVIRIQERAGKLAAGYTVNELRIEDGEEPIDDPNADVAMIAAGLTTLEQAINPPDPLAGMFGPDDSPLWDDAPEPEKDKEKPEPKESDKTLEVLSKALEIIERMSERLATKQSSAVMAQDTAVTSSTAPVASPADEINEEHECDHPHGDCKQSELWEVKDDRPKPLARLPEDGVNGFQSAMDKALKEMAQEVAALLNAGEMAAVEALLASPRWVDLVAEAARPFVSRAMLLGGKVGLSRLPRIPDGVVFEMVNPRVQEFVNRYTVQLSTEIAGNTQVALRDLIGDGLEKGETIQQLANRVTEYDKSVSGARAHMIARSESARAYTQGQIQAWKETGVVKGRTWVLSPGACEFCQAAAAEFNNKVVPLDSHFYTKGSVLQGTEGGVMTLDYMDVDGSDLHPHCRCDILPVLSEEQPS